MKAMRFRKSRDELSAGTEVMVMRDKAKREYSRAMRQQEPED